MISVCLLLLSAHSVTAFMPPPSAMSRRTTACFAGGGFGAPSKKAPKKKANKKSKSKSSILSDIQVDEAPKLSTSTPKLDRFGLPIPTEDSIFPPLTSDVLRIPVNDRDDEFNKQKVAEAMQHHIGVNLDLFDENGQSIHEEKSSDNGSSNRWKLKLLHQDPPVLAVENFFSEADVEQYKAMIESNEGSSNGGENNGGAVQLSSPTFSSSLSLSRRTSTTWFCKYKSMTCLLAKAHALLGVDLNQMEEPQLVRYRTGEEFSWHYDEIPSAQLSNGGQRLATLLVYLNDLGDDRGGGTVFRDLKPPVNESSKRKKRKSSSKENDDQLTVRPKSGTALLFFPAFADGKPDIRTLHKGEVALDTKMIAQLWIHEHEYNASVPENNLQADAASGVRGELERLGIDVV